MPCEWHRMFPGNTQCSKETEVKDLEGEGLCLRHFLLWFQRTYRISYKKYLTNSLQKKSLLIMENKDEIKKQIDNVRAKIAANESIIRDLSKAGFMKCISEITTTNNELRAKIDKLKKLL